MPYIPLVRKGSYRFHAGLVDDPAVLDIFEPVPSLCGKMGRVPVFRDGYTLADVDCKTCLNSLYKVKAFDNSVSSSDQAYATYANLTGGSKNGR